MMEIRRHGTNYLVIHGERLRGNRYESLVASLDGRADLKLVSRRPWFALGKHSTISVYRLLQTVPASRPGSPQGMRDDDSSHGRADQAAAR
jgi:hypothetical protein